MVWKTSKAHTPIRGISSKVMIYFLDNLHQDAVMQGGIIMHANEFQIAPPISKLILPSVPGVMVI